MSPETQQFLDALRPYSSLISCFALVLVVIPAWGIYSTLILLRRQIYQFGAHSIYVASFEFLYRQFDERTIQARIWVEANALPAEVEAALSTYIDGAETSLDNSTTAILGQINWLLSVLARFNKLGQSYRERFGIPYKEFAIVINYDYWVGRITKHPTLLKYAHKYWRGEIPGVESTVFWGGVTSKFKVFLQQLRRQFAFSEAVGVRSMNQKTIPNDPFSIMMEYNKKAKSIGIAYILWFLFGLLGVHRLYMTRYKTGGTMFILLILSVAMIIGGVDVIGGSLFVILLICALVDAFLIPSIVRKVNAISMQELKQTAG